MTDVLRNRPLRLVGPVSHREMSSMAIWIEITRHWGHILALQQELMRRSITGDWR
jgi:hypothetical protein